MAGELTFAQGKYLVELARKAAKNYVLEGKQITPESEEGILGQERGVFVTLQTHPAGDLRGCIGYPLPVKPLARAVIDNAIHASTKDPRFPPVSGGELSKIVFEVSVLTLPKKLVVATTEDYPKVVKIGRDGLIVSYGSASGLLLPQVPIEWNWNSREFLENACQKAGLPKDMWHSPSTKIETFQAQIFYEEKPEGKIIEKKLVSGR